MSDIEILGMSLPLFVAELGILVTALSAAVGIWIERDHSKPIGKAVALTILVFFAGGLCVYQTWANDKDQAELQADLAKILEQLDHVAIKSEVELPDLNDALKTELTIHGRANPKVLMNLAKSIAAKGGDPLKFLAAYLPEADLQAMKRDGKFDEALADPKVGTAADAKRPKLVFGSESSPFLRSENSDMADAGVPDAAIVMNEPADGGAPDAGAVADILLDAGADAAAAASANANRERESLKRQIEEARKQLAAAKTWQEKREPQRKLFELLGSLDRLEKATGAQLTTTPATTTTTTPTPSVTTSSTAKKPKIDIEEDDTP